MSSEVQEETSSSSQYPEDTSLSYAKSPSRLPGDEFSYIYNKRLKINDEEIQIRRIGDYVHNDAPIAPTNIWNDSATTSTQSSSSRKRLLLSLP